MTDREKKQREILESLVSHTICNIDVPRSFTDRENIDHALSELAKLDTMPKEVEEAVKVVEKEYKINYPIETSDERKQALQTLIQAINPKEEGEK